jgi:CheY-like chemotaxis protein
MLKSDSPSLGSRIFGLLGLSPVVSDFHSDGCKVAAGPRSAPALFRMLRRIALLFCPDPEALQEPKYLDARSNGAILLERPTRILIVEDERHIARLLEFVLRKAGYEPSVCHSGEQALQEMEKSKPDALVLDLFLPGISGIDFLRAIRGAPYFCSCVVITLSGHSLDHLDTVLADAGATVQCSKPIAPTTLLKKLQQLGVQQSRPLEVE